MALGNTVYNLFFRRSSTFYLTVFVGAVIFERAVDQLGDSIFDHLNKGKQWKDIKHKYETSQE